jgi:hypothetical protein
MSSQAIDFRTLPNNVPSLCIPRVFPNINEKRIRGIFDDLNMGEIQRIDIVSKMTDKGEKFNRVFVHFKRWFSNANADTARERLINGKEIKIIYDDPWFWKVSAYREPNKAAPSRPQVNKKVAHLQFDSDEDRAQTNHSSRQTDEFGRDIQRPRQQHKPRPKPRQDHKLRPEEPVPRSPSSSPPRRMEDAVEQPFKIDYGSCPIPVKKRNILAKKTPLKIEMDVEEGEITEN